MPHLWLAYLQYKPFTMSLSYDDSPPFFFSFQPSSFTFVPNVSISNNFKSPKLALPSYSLLCPITYMPYVTSSKTPKA